MALENKILELNNGILVAVYSENITTTPTFLQLMINDINSDNVAGDIRYTVSAANTPFYFDTKIFETKLQHVVSYAT